MPTFATIATAVRNGVALVTLDRPEKHNAFDERLIAELTQALLTLDAMPDVRAVVLLGAGESFCAGADLDWMRRMAAFDYEQNLADARALARLLQVLSGLAKPTVARVHGPAYGGGVGLVACCDIAIAAIGATFALSEARLGLIPATIGPYVVEAMGARAARRYMLTGERFEAAEAYRIGLVHDLAPSVEALDERVNDLLGALMLAGPHAQTAVKALVRAIAHRPIDERVVGDTAERIATVRASDEAREGVAAFLGKRSPAWVPAALRAKRKR
ncbi:MAG: enoyl-CoA hydratase/isomerase family protein [Betaproteobacteria bacterium]|nr:enoyl-CoA hydratase/isomerase family protein [Betaproteobacteria bacterium]